MEHSGFLLHICLLASFKRLATFLKLAFSIAKLLLARTYDSFVFRSCLWSKPLLRFSLSLDVLSSSISLRRVAINDVVSLRSCYPGIKPSKAARASAALVALHFRPPPVVALPPSDPGGLQLALKRCLLILLLSRIRHFFLQMRTHARLHDDSALPQMNERASSEPHARPRLNLGR